MDKCTQRILDFRYNMTIIVFTFLFLNLIFHEPSKNEMKTLEATLKKEFDSREISYENSFPDI